MFKPYTLPKHMFTPSLLSLIEDATRAGLQVDAQWSRWNDSSTDSLLHRSEFGLRIHGNGRDLVVAPNGWAYDPRVDSRAAKSIRAYADMRRALGLPQAPQNTL